MDTIWLVVEPTLLKNDGVRQLGWWHSQYMENKKCSKPPTSYRYSAKIMHRPRHAQKKRTYRRSALKPFGTMNRYWTQRGCQLTAGRKVEKPEGITLQSHIINCPSTLVVDHTSSIQKTIGYICPWNIEILRVARLETEKAPGWHLFCHSQTHTKTIQDPNQDHGLNQKKEGMSSPGWD